MGIRRRVGIHNLSLHVPDHGSECAPEMREQGGDTLVVEVQGADARIALAHRVPAVDALKHLSIIVGTVCPAMNVVSSPSRSSRALFF